MNTSDIIAVQFKQAIEHQKRGRLADAVMLYDAINRLNPNIAVVHCNRGNVLYSLKRFDEALRDSDRAIELNPNFAEAYNNRGNVLQALKRLNEALQSYDRAIQLKPEYVEAHYNRGTVLHDLKRFGEALQSCDQAIKFRPEHAEAYNNRGNVLHALKHFDEAIQSYDRAIQINPNFAESFNNKGNALQALKKFNEAFQSFGRAIELKPNYAEAYNNKGNVLHALKRFDEALQNYDRAIQLKPDYAEAYNNKGNILHALKRFDEALQNLDRAIKLKPDYAEAYNNKGNVLQALKRFDEAIQSCDRARSIDSDHIFALGGVATAALDLGDWARTATIGEEVKAHIAARKSIIPPFVLLGYSGDASLQLQCARNFLQDKIPVPPRPLWEGVVYGHDKIRIAYLSADFRKHPVAFLMAELFERHDRRRFECVGISFGPDDGSDIRTRLVKSFDRFHDVRSQSDYDVAKLLREHEVDIAVDLMGYTQDARPEILSYRPAPVQVNYLGYPSTMGAEFIDYVISDKTVLPFDQQPFFTEKIVHLPDCYQVNDSKRAIAEKTPSRQEAGLPEQGFVFCCFNNGWKVTAPMFEVWMRLLSAVPNSVLWLLEDNASATNNLCVEAKVRGIDPQRLVFAKRIMLEEHLARHRLADLFLDTLPYNAHTTASDALWAGLPLITCQGESFSGRVAASLLKAIGLQELVTHNLEAYETLALTLARDASLLQSFRQKLKQNRSTHPLFDTNRFQRNIEAAYTQMWQIAECGEPTQSVAVEPDV